MHLNRLLQRKSAHESPIWSLAWCPDNSFLTGALDETVVHWTMDPSIHDVDKKHTFLSHGLGTVFLSVHQQGRYAASSCLDGCVRVWDIQDHAKKLHIFQTAASENWGIHFAPILEKVILAVAGGSTSSISIYTLDEETKKHMTLKMPRFRDQQQRHQRSSFVLNAKFSPDGRRIVGSCDNGLVIAFDIESGKELFTFAENTTPVRTVGFSPNSEIFVTGSDAAYLTFYDMKSGSVISTIDSRWSKSSKAYEDPSMFLDLSFHPNGVSLVTSTANGKISLWDMHTKERLQLIEDHQDAVWSAQFNTDGSQVVSVCEDGSFSLFSVLTDV